VRRPEGSEKHCKWRSLRLLAESNRNRQELENIIGFFVNLQCIRVTVQDESFEVLVQRVLSTTAEASAHQDVPFERIVAEYPTRQVQVYQCSVESERQTRIVPMDYAINPGRLAGVPQQSSRRVRPDVQTLLQ
jgi:non-ribosomal peptide synthetase component F